MAQQDPSIAKSHSQPPWILKLVWESSLAPAEHGSLNQSAFRLQLQISKELKLFLISGISFHSQEFSRIRARTMLCTAITSLKVFTQTGVRNRCIKFSHHLLYSRASKSSRYIQDDTIRVSHPPGGTFPSLGTPYCSQQGKIEGCLSAKQGMP